MNNLGTTLDTMHRIQRDLFAAVQQAEHGSSATIVTLRQEFAEVCGTFLADLQSWLHQGGNVALFMALQNEFDAMRLAVVQHQYHWTPQAIAANYEVYLRRSRALGRQTQQFLDHASAAACEQWTEAA